VYITKIKLIEICPSVTDIKQRDGRADCVVSFYVHFMQFVPGSHKKLQHDNLI